MGKKFQWTWGNYRRRSAQATSRSSSPVEANAAGAKAGRLDWIIASITVWSNLWPIAAAQWNTVPVSPTAKAAKPASQQYRRQPAIKTATIQKAIHIGEKIIGIRLVDLLASMFLWFKITSRPSIKNESAQKIRIQTGQLNPFWDVSFFSMVRS